MHASGALLKPLLRLRRAFHQAIDAGHGEEDFAAVVEPLRPGS